MITTITNYVNAVEKVNSGDIYIWLTDDCSPAVYENSAIRLNACFPEFPLTDTIRPDGKKCKMITGFPLEKVIEKFMGYHQLVDDRCIHILNVRP